MKTIAQQIAETAGRLRATKPRSNMRLKLELELRALIVKQLRKEIRQERRAA
jgi:hypothetical protein